jgi:antitoxin component YwqK of YwqJK toxin-antitoxin module
LLLLSQLSFSQEKIYFDENWQECSKSKAAYYRLIENLDNGLYFVKDYYITGKLQFEGTSTVNTEPLIRRRGIWYYEKEKLKLWFYKDGLLNGKYFDYYEDGQLFEEGFYKNDKRDGLFVTYDSDESIFTYLNYKENILDGLYVEVIEGDTICSAFFKNNELNGPYYRYILSKKYKHSL